ncbi:kinase-like domain-containing protein [Cristinia sonorae]|uniref:Altered inheritance of mitochondria protein 9, mitochondrial n=1 Tax=Cristinia sonorae TaxID=1940300 RepID=A0A8K0UPB7_9AGAR|nr:kinase-like domain-containing protein [Cristinia sonorae]
MQRLPHSVRRLRLSALVRRPLPRNRSLGTSPAAEFSTAPRPEPESLFTHTTYRWLANERHELKARYSPFNVDAVERIACHAVSARQCVSWQKLGEGAFNKAFLLHFDNNARAVFRIPCPIFGDASKAIASEVATMTYLRERWAHNESLAKPPRVLAWDSHYDNPAETPYMILDFVDGVTLNSRWGEIQGQDALDAMESIAYLETTLMRGDHEFSQLGSLYFAEDVSEELRSRPLYLEQDKLDPAAQELAARYRIGPIADREWWRGVLCPSGYRPRSIAAEFQLRALDSKVVDFSDPFVRSTPADIPQLRRLLGICIRIAPFLAPREASLVRPVLNHPDLTLDNVMVAAEGSPSAVSFIDWQGAFIAPYFYHSSFPPALEYPDGIIAPLPGDGTPPPFPDGFDEMPSDIQHYYRVRHRFAMRHRSYLYKMALLWDSLRFDAWNLPHYNALLNLVGCIVRCIGYGPVDLQEALVSLQRQWSTFAPEDCPCPIGFTEEECAAYEAEERVQAEYIDNVRWLSIQLACRRDGMVIGKYFDEVYAEMLKQKEQWDEVALKGPFPFREGGYSSFLG